MSFLRRGERRRGRVATVLTTVGAIAAFQALAIVGAGMASAVTACTYNPATDTINITIDPTEVVGVAVEGADGSAGDLDPAAPAGSILANLNGAGFLACGSASNSNTVSIIVLGSVGSDESFAINNNVGGTGLTGEFATTIVWSIDLGTGTGDLLAFHLGDGDDALTVTNDSFTLNGGGAPAGDLLGVELLRVTAEDGDDTVDLSATAFSSPGGSININGGPGDDVILPGTATGDFIAGGADTDTLSYANRTTSTFVLNGSDAGLDANGDGDNDDVGDESDVLLDCFEVVQTGIGNDTIDDNGCGTTTFIPGDGNDDITGNLGGDTLDWSSSSAGMIIDIPNESATGQGTDVWDSVESFVGSPFDDTMLVDDDAPGTGVQEFSGGDGVDTVDASAATSGVNVELDILDPSGADDLENVVGSAFSDNLEGNDLRNMITAGAGDDFLDGQPGNDTLLGEAGNDTFDGGDGADRVSFANSPQGVNVDLSLGFAVGEGDDGFNDLIEIIVGSAFNDDIVGGPFSGGGTVNFLLVGKAGNDNLTGFNGNDTLKGGGGGDVLRGVGGDDTLKGAAGNDRIFGGGGTDIGKGGDGQDRCKGVEIRTSCGTQGNPARVAGRLV